ncbi:hypothetical protein C1T31_10090 [Hanstruepera neustonica]|uniref:Uncharacterized protein n=1 Tax=Hanstruepera neustonica TaxID=1445657 RepID=A0A2K1DXU6_9FLAO|nr:hypothetical protein [Hanstruepera neustonica]PNQ72845.1 hypothetical protein C1T31_10090 [Hanstruepera neustonica]
MARNNSFIRLEGSLDGLTFYRKDGESFVKTQSRVSRNRIMNDPAYKRTRENMQEFGGAAKAGKAFREAFAGLSQTIGDTYLSARLSGLLKRIIKLGAGDRGERELDLASYHEQFRGFEFNPNKQFDSVFFAPLTGPTINATRDVVDLTVPDFNTDAFINAPEGATHFSLILATGYVSNYGFVPVLTAYEPVDETVNARGSVTTSSAIALGGMVGSATTLQVDMSALGAIPVEVAVFVGLGIVFYQEVNGNMYALAQDHALKVATTG